MRLRVEVLGHVLSIQPAPGRHVHDRLAEDAAPCRRTMASEPSGLSETGRRFERHYDHQEPRWRSPGWILPITGGGVLAVTLAQVLGTDPSKPVEIVSAIMGMTAAALILHVMRKKSGG